MKCYIYAQRNRWKKRRDGQIDHSFFNMEFVRIDFIHPIIIDMQVFVEKLVPALGLVMAACHTMYFLQYASCKYII